MTNQKDAMPEWKSAYEWEGLYSVSNYGEVRNDKTGNILKGFIDLRGYKCVLLSGNGNAKARKRHKLVAETFIGLRPEKSVINHKDGNRLNNYVGNLEFVSQRENVAHGKSCKEYVGVTYWARDDMWQSRIQINNKRFLLGYFPTKEQAAAAYINALKDRGLENKYAE